MEYISVSLRLYPQGYQFEKPNNVSFVYDGIGTIDESGLAILRPSDQKFFQPGKGDWTEECLTDHVVNEDFFVLEGVSVVHDLVITGWGKGGDPYWAAENMSESNYEDFEHNMIPLCADAMRLINEAYDPTPKILEGSGLLMTSTKEPDLEDRKKPIEITILTRWSVDTSTDWESGHTEVDGFTYQGLAYIVSELSEKK